MEKRVLETEKVGNIYKKLIEDLPEDLEKYKTIIRKTKDEIINSLKEANEEKDLELEKLSEIKLKELELQEKIISELPELRNNFIEINKNFNIRLKTLKLISYQWTNKIAIYTPPGNEIPFLNTIRDLSNTFDVNFFNLNPEIDFPKTEKNEEKE